jgi:hypothetical protein
VTNEPLNWFVDVPVYSVVNDSYDKRLLIFLPTFVLLCSKIAESCCIMKSLKIEMFSVCKASFVSVFPCSNCK